MTIETYMADGATVGRIFGEKENTAPLQEIASLVQQIESIMGDFNDQILGVDISIRNSYIQLDNECFLENFTDFEIDVSEGDFPYEFIAQIEEVKFIAVFETEGVLDLKDTHPETWEYVQRKIQEES